MAEAYNKKGCDDEYDMKEECPRAARSVAFRSRVAAASVARRRCYDLGGVAAVISAAACAHQPDPPHFPPFLFNPFPPFPFVPSPPARAHTSVFPPPFSSPPPIVCSHGAASPLWSSDRLDHLEWRGSGPHREWQQGVAGVECDQQGERSGGGAGPIANGSRGWLVSSVTGRERECGREIVNVLDEWCDKLEAGKAQGEGEGEARTGEGASAGKAKGGSSIDALLANEVAALKKQARLQSIREDARKGGKGEKGGKQLEEGEEKEEEGEKEEVGKTEEGKRRRRRVKETRRGRRGIRPGKRSRRKSRRKRLQEEERRNRRRRDREGRGRKGRQGESREGCRRVSWQRRCCGMPRPPSSQPLGGCGVVGVGQWVWGSGCGAVGVGQWVWGSGCGAVGVGQWVWGSGCGAVGVRQWVWGSGCGAVGVGQWDGCGAVGVGQWVWGSGCEAVGVGQWVWGSGCGAVGVRQWVWGSGCGAVGVGQWVWGSGCGAVGVGQWVWGSGCGAVGGKATT
ncbi:unnamed protein product [Closterium sp. NIES-64]|nr:unnamed protein product [Closterium sp. NIES-64]